MSHFKQAGLATFPCSGKRTFFIAEKFAFQKRLGQRSAVDGHKRGVLSVTGVVQCLRHQLFACAGFSVDQNWRIVGRIQAYAITKLFHGL